MLVILWYVPPFLPNGSMNNIISESRANINPRELKSMKNNKKNTFIMSNEYITWWVRLEMEIAFKFNPHPIE